MDDAASTRSDYSLSGLAPELFVSDLRASLHFYRDQLGFGVVRESPGFAVLSLGEARVQLALPDESVPGMNEWIAAGRRGIGVNVRIIVGDVDGLYRRARGSGIRVIREVGDRFYGLRDFTVVDPDGFVLSFASPASAV